MSAMNEEFTSASPAPESAGAILAAARREQGLDVEEISGRLHLSAWQIEALENDQYDRLAGPTFIRGIIRSYAKTLLIDPQPALDAYGRLAPNTATPNIGVPSQNIRFQPCTTREGSAYLKAGLLLFAALAIIGAGGWLWYMAPGNVIGKPAVTPPANPAPDGTPQPATPASLPPPVENAAPVPAPAVDTAGAQAPSVIPPTVQEVVPPPQVIPAGQSALRFTFQKEAWLEVKDGTGRIVFSQLKPAGSEQVLTGKPPFELIVGNAAHVALTYNDKPVDLKSYVNVHVARLTLQ